MSEVKHTPVKCDGSCSTVDPPECRGEVRCVHVVSSSGYDWGDFNYCEEAIDHDRKQGFCVTEAAIQKAEAADE